ncbi:MAG: lipopolysaccharide heptosyltransferase II [Kiritimatiellae bacterium]|nr:lipopolysaccharide heptosyltransferase II [Kiritimatiellia bacterium]
MSEHVLICGVNWLGDAVMSMPALQLFRRQHPDVRITIAVKSRWRDLWRMQSAVDEVIEFPACTGDMWRVARMLSADGYNRAIILPNSFRSALVPFLAGIPQRRGVPGQLRSLLLTDQVRMSRSEGAGQHQAWEYMQLLGVDPQSDVLPLPALEIDAGVVQGFLGEHSKEERWIGVLPGAARGASKRWPTDRFVQAAKALADKHSVRVMVLGAPAEASLCGQVAEGIGDSAVNLGGRTSIPELAALLQQCELVLCNDSGGMHLASAVGTPVVAIFGMTDPTVTGPIGSRHRVIRAEVAHASRDIPRESAAAEAALRSITVQQVCAAAESVLAESER